MKRSGSWGPLRFPAASPERGYVPPVRRMAAPCSHSPCVWVRTLTPSFGGATLHPLLVCAVWVGADSPQSQRPPALAWPVISQPRGSWGLCRTVGKGFPLPLHQDGAGGR